MACGPFFFAHRRCADGPAQSCGRSSRTRYPHHDSAAETPAPIPRAPPSGSTGNGHSSSHQPGQVATHRFAPIGRRVTHTSYHALNLQHSTQFVPTTLAFADYKGNRQLLSMGNLSVNDCGALFLMDYLERERLKILGRARVEDARSHPRLGAQVTDPDMKASMEPVVLIDVVSFDWNCMKYITPRYSLAEVEELARLLRTRIAELEAQLRAVKV